jgi:hypothetical protein
MLESVSLIVISYSRVFNKDSKWGLKAGEIFICIDYYYVQAGILYKSGNPDVAVRLNSITKSNKNLILFVFYLHVLSNSRPIYINI